MFAKLKAKAEAERQAAAKAPTAEKSIDGHARPSAATTTAAPPVAIIAAPSPTRPIVSRLNGGVATASPGVVAQGGGVTSQAGPSDGDTVNNAVQPDASTTAPSSTNSITTSTVSEPASTLTDSANNDTSEAPPLAMESEGDARSSAAPTDNADVTVTASDESNDAVVEDESAEPPPSVSEVSPSETTAAAAAAAPTSAHDGDAAVASGVDGVDGNTEAAGGDTEEMESQVDAAALVHTSTEDNVTATPSASDSATDVDSGAAAPVDVDDVAPLVPAAEACDNGGGGGDGGVDLLVPPVADAQPASADATAVADDSLVTSATAPAVVIVATDTDVVDAASTSDAQGDAAHTRQSVVDAAVGAADATLPSDAPVAGPAAPPDRDDSDNLIAELEAELGMADDTASHSERLSATDTITAIAANAAAGGVAGAGDVHTPVTPLEGRARSRSNPFAEGHAVVAPLRSYTPEIEPGPLPAGSVSATEYDRVVAELMEIRTERCVSVFSFPPRISSHRATDSHTICNRLYATSHTLCWCMYIIRHAMCYSSH